MSFIVSRRKTKNRFEFISWSDINAKSFGIVYACMKTEKKKFLDFHFIFDKTRQSNTNYISVLNGLIRYKNGLS